MSSLKVEPRKGRRVWVAEFEGANGRTRRVLGPAWVRDTGKRTARGAVIWRAAPGAKPDAEHLTPGEAEEALAALEAAAKAAEPVKVKGRTWGQAADAFIDHAENVRRRADSTIAGYRSQINSLEREGHLPRSMPLARVTARRLDQIQARMLRDRKVSAKTVHNRMLLVRSVLGHAQSKRWVSGAVLADVERLPAPDPHPDFHVLEPSQVESVARAMLTVPDSDVPRYVNGEVDERLLQIMRDVRKTWSELVRLAAYTGLRFGELRALEWGDLDIAGAVVRVVRNHPSTLPALGPGERAKVPKGKKARSVPLIDPAIAALERLSRLVPQARGRALVFQTGAGGMLQAGAVRDAFYTALGEVGLGHLRVGDRPIVLHDLRHTFGTIAVRVFPLSDVKEFMGHADIATTMRYVHHQPQTTAAAQLTAAFSRDLGQIPVGDQEQQTA